MEHIAEEKPKRAKKGAAYKALEDKVKELEQANTDLRDEYQQQWDGMRRDHTEELQKCSEPYQKLLKEWALVGKIVAGYVNCPTFISEELGRLVGENIKLLP